MIAAQLDGRRGLPVLGDRHHDALSRGQLRARRGLAVRAQKCRLLLGDRDVKWTRPQLPYADSVVPLPKPGVPVSRMAFSMMENSSPSDAEGPMVVAVIVTGRSAKTVPHHRPADPPDPDLSPPACHAGGARPGISEDVLNRHGHAIVRLTHGSAPRSLTHFQYV